MSNQLKIQSQIDEVLILLRCSATNLLLAYDKTLSPELWTAYEITAEICEFLMYQQKVPVTIH